MTGEDSPGAPLDLPARANAPHRPDQGQWRSFAVEAVIGRKMAGWPFSRIDIATAGLKVRVRFPWFVERSALRETITLISVGTRFGGTYCLRFEDTTRWLEGVHVHPMPYQGERIMAELLRAGYRVVERKSGAELARLPSRWRSV